MSRLNLLASWFFTCLGITLLMLLPFIAPEKAFGDDAYCENACCDLCFQTVPGANP